MNSRVFRPRPTDNSLIPDVIFVLLITNGLVYALQWQFPEFINSNFALHSLNASRYVPGGDFQVWQLLTYGFLHSMSSLYHIAFNMLALWMFGRDLERIMGPQRFAIFWVVCVVGAGIVQLLVSVVTGQPSITVGASGGVFGVLMAFALAFPNRTIMLLFPPIPMRAKYFVALYGLFTLFLGVSGGAPRIAHFAHLGGMLFGYLAIRYWARDRRRR